MIIFIDVNGYYSRTSIDEIPTVISVTLVCLFQEQSDHRPRRHLRPERRSRYRILRDHRIVMLIICKIRHGSILHEVAVVQLNLDRPFVMRFVDDGDRDRPVRVFERTDIHVLRAASRFYSYRAWSGESEVARERPKTARDLEAVVLETNQDGIATGTAGIVLRAPPM